MQRLPTTSDTASAWLMAGVLVNLASVARGGLQPGVGPAGWLCLDGAAKTLRNGLLPPNLAESGIVKPSVVFFRSFPAWRVVHGHG
jgi:hypothetical protein